MPLATTSLKLDASVKQRIQKLAETRRRSANWPMGEAIREFGDRKEARDHWTKTRSTPGMTTSQPANMSAMKSSMPGWPAWKPERMSRRPNPNEAHHLVATRRPRS